MFEVRWMKSLEDIREIRGMCTAETDDRILHN
jgi:hypothetical protein